MKYALNLAEDGRILSATYPQYAPATAVIVEMLPEGNIYEYRYQSGEYIHDPLPTADHPTAPRNIEAGEYVTVNGVLYKTTENIPAGEPILAGQNAIVTTVEEQLHDLTKGE